MAGAKEMKATISLAGKIDPSLAKSVEQAQKQVEKLAKMDKLKSAFSSVGQAALNVGKAVATGLATAAGAAASAATAIGAAALSNYSDYEQMVGGIETLFGTGGQNIYEYANSVGKSVFQAEDEFNALMAAQNAVFANAESAYKTAGVSANTYMEQATNFSASLVQSLGGDTMAAANYADLAIKDMSDNANKMGTDIESIQQTYQSLMRGNYAIDELPLAA